MIAGRVKGQALALDSNPTLPVLCKLRQILKMAPSFSVAIFKLGINTSASQGFVRRKCELAQSKLSKKLTCLLLFLEKPS